LKRHLHKTIRLADLATVRKPSGHLQIREHRFENCKILGPIVVVPGTETPCNFSGMKVGQAGGFESAAYSFEVGTLLPVGFVLMDACEMLNCSTEHVTFAGIPSFIEGMVRAMLAE
jgi:hypothetical protein